jgi:putative transposase
MSAQRFSIGTQFRWNGTLYEVKRILPDGAINIENVATTALQVVCLSELVASLFQGDLSFVIRGKRKEPNSPELQTDNVIECAELSDYPDDLAAIARKRLEIIKPLLQLGPRCMLGDVKARVEEVRAFVNDDSGEQTLMLALSWRSVYRWKSDYLTSGGDIRSLIPVTRKRGGEGQSRLDPEVEALVASVIRDNYYRPEKVTVQDLMCLVAAAIEDENRLRPLGERLSVPSESTIVRRVDALDMYKKFAARYGKRAARRQFKQYGMMTYPERPLERVEIDNTSLDLIVVDENDYLPLGRLNLTKALDTATRYTGFEPPSYYSAMECLYHTICPKADIRELYGTEHHLQGYGVPGSLVVDNGKEFIGRDLEDACLLLGITLEYSPVRTPEFKAAIERYFRTCNGLFHALPGTTFGDIFQRGNYDSTAQACITQGELERLLHIFLADIYAERFHKGLGRVPARQWEEAMGEGYSPRLPPSAEDALILLGRVAYRTVQHYGIDFLNLRYNCPELARLRNQLNGKQAKIKYHPGDLSRLYVHNPFDEVYIVVPALAGDYTDGLSLWKHRVICAYVRRHQDQVDLAALGRAKRKIQEVVDMAMSRKRRRGGRKLGRWNSSGKPPSLGDRSASATPLSSAAQAPPAAPGELSIAPPSPDHDDSILAVEQSEEEGWGISYSLPRSDAPPVTTQEAVTDDPE